MKAKEFIHHLEKAWDLDGFLDGLRRGNFDPIAGEKFIQLIRAVSIKDDELVPKRLLSLAWYLPSFLEWQKERIAEESSTAAELYNHFVTDVQNELEKTLGVP